jgi:hypothetical protein
VRPRPFRGHDPAGPPAQRRRDPPRPARAATRHRGGPGSPGSVRKILAVNVALFWGKHETRLAELRRLLQPGGRIALVHQPRGPGASDETAIESGRHLAAALEAAGFAAIRVETLPLRPAVVCAVGEEPAEGRGQPSSGR